MDQNDRARAATEKKQDTWFHENVVTPTIEAWGDAGWDRISGDMKLDAVYARAGRLVMNSARLEEPESSHSAEAYVRYVQMVSGCLLRWRNRAGL